MSELQTQIAENHANDLTRPSQFKRRIIWVILGVLALLILFTGGFVYAARIPDQEICLLLDQRGGTAAPVGIVDLNSGVSMPDRRYASAGIYQELSPDRQYYAFIGSDGSQTGFYVRKIDWNNRFNRGQDVLVQSGISDDDATRSYWMNHMQWSPDSSQISLAWADAKQLMHLTLANADGSNVHTISLPPNLTDEDIFVQGWSPDNRYFMISERDVMDGSYFSIWSAADLTPVNLGTLKFRKLAWSPDGKHLAGLRIQGRQPVELAILSPETGTEQVIRLPIDQVIETLTWSPDSKSVALHSYKRACNYYGQCQEYWRFDIFSVEGKALYPAVIGMPWQSTTYSQSTLNPYTATGLWSGDGRSWVFLRERDDPSKVLDLVALRLDTGAIETIASNIARDLAGEMFFISSAQRFQRPVYQNDLLTPEGSRLIVPTWEGGKLNVDLIDLNGETKIRLVQGATSILRPYESYTSTSMFWRRDLLIVLSTNGYGSRQTVNLTWANSDGTNLHTFSGTMRNIRLSRWYSDSTVLTFLAEYENSNQLEMLNLNTGEYRVLLKNLPDVSSWVTLRAANPDIMALQLNGYYGSGALARGLYLVKPDSIEKLNDNAYSWPIWSSDGSRLAYLRSDAIDPDQVYLDVVDVDGKLIQSMPLKKNQRDIYLNGWTPCYRK